MVSTTAPTGALFDARPARPWAVWPGGRDAARRSMRGGGPKEASAPSGRRPIRARGGPSGNRRGAIMSSAAMEEPR